MTDSAPTGRSFSSGFVRFFKRVFGGFRRADRQADSWDRPTAKIDLGDLAVAQLVHDLRNQLTIIAACAENLVYLVPRGQADQEIAELQECAERSSDLTRELLMAARPRAVARLAVDLNHLVAPVADMLARISGERIRVQVRLASESVPVVAEYLELERILINLALNARDAMAGEGVLTIETAVIDQPWDGSIETTLTRPQARLTVSDTGSGMTPDVKARMFEPFFTTKESGTGLGLSSVAFTVRQLGGTVSVTTRPGRGTSISVTFPLARRRSPDQK